MKELKTKELMELAETVDASSDKEIEDTFGKTKDEMAKEIADELKKRFEK